jgi:hypothetical protein
LPDNCSGFSLVFSVILPNLHGKKLLKFYSTENVIRITISEVEWLKQYSYYDNIKIVGFNSEYYYIL